MPRLEESNANPIGDLADHYGDVERLGDGAEGGAFGATERATGRRVVLKRVPPEQWPAVRFAFGILRRTGSPHLPVPRALLTSRDGSGWMVTDWVAGSPLPLARAPRVVDALAEARAVAHALAAIHGAGTHHGDVAPGNVVVTPTGGVVLVDLGQLGRHGLGTPGFLAPEVLAGGGGPAADRFSLGCLLCLRLLGEPPWRRPEALLEVRDPAAVEGRLHALGSADLDPPVRALLARLLHPRPEQRLADPGQLVSHLARLHAAAEAGLDLRRAEPWWPPARWPYQGPSLTPVVERLVAPQPPRLVAVAGPAGVGRGRVVEELVQSVQAHAGAVARSCEPSRLPRVLGRPGPWLQAWRTAEGGGVVGLLERPRWPSALAARGATASRAAVLQEIAAQAGVTLVIPVSTALGEALAARGVTVVRVEPWSEDDVAQLLEGVVDPPQRRAWAVRLHAATGGWPARVVRAAAACAAAQLDDPGAPAVVDALARAAEAAPELHPGVARAVMLAVWGSAAAMASLPAHLHDGERPWAAVEAAARRRLGTELPELARDVAAATRGEGGELGLSLALDADRPAAIERHLDAHGEETPALARWLDAGGAARLPPATVAAAMRQRLVRGDVEAALRLAAHAPCPDGWLVQARALQRRGRLSEAQAAAEQAATAADPTVAWSARGLRWRLWIDEGQAARALAQAREALLHAPPTGLGPATARLWAAMAALTCGEHEQASAWLDAAVTAVADEPSAEAAGVLARAHQLHGNLAQARGDLRMAQARYAQAAEAFEAAGEAVGGLVLRGSLTGLAVLAYEVAAGLAHGRAAVGGLVALGQLSATLEAGLNLVQLLVRVGDEPQAAALARLLEDLHGGTQPALVRGRLERVRAELSTLRLQPGPHGAVVRGAQAAAESRFVGAAEHLARAEAAAEASEAFRHAAGLARVQGRQARAQAYLERARTLAGPDDDAHAELELEAALLDLAGARPDAPRMLEASPEPGRGDDPELADPSHADPRRDARALAPAAHLDPLGRAAHLDPLGRAALDRALERLTRLPGPRVWLERGRIDLAFAYDRTLLAALRRRLPSDHPARRQVARRWLSTLELVMKQTGPLDRTAVRNNLLVDGGDPQPLRDLLAELDDLGAAARGATAVPPAAPDSPASEHARFEQLLRIHRRLAREDRLDLLLQQVVDAMMDLTDAERGAVVVLPTAHTERLEVTRELAEGSEGVRFSRSVIERVLAEGEPVLSVDAAADDRFDGSRSISHLNLRSVLAVPLQFRGERLGAAYVDHRLRRGNFDEEDLARMEEFAELAALAVAHARALAELRAQAAALHAQQAELARLLEAREAEVLGLREEVRSAQGPRGYRGIIGTTPIMTRIFKLVDRVADADVPVVIHGESGTGKELVARALHDAGPRRSGPFIAENCGAIPETLLESVLFGHAKGAFTGAVGAKAGLFEAASGGTIFLDEVGEMSAAMQTKLLRVLQEGEVRRVGENRSRPIDVRVIAASNRDLPTMVERGEFRRDLYYRINVIKIELPALRERIDDLPALVEHFLRSHQVEGRPPLRVSPAAMRRLALHPWPGNVRELENEVQRWVALCEGEVGPDDLSIAPPRGGTGMATDDAAPEDDDLQIRPRVDKLERALIARAMDRTSGNQTKAAELLGLSRFGLQKKLRRLAEPEGGEA